MTQPPLTIPSAVEIEAAEKRVLPNGMALYTLPANDFEVLRVTFVFRAGPSVQRVPFSASTTANLLAEGTRRFTARELAERLDYYGSWYDVNLDRDYAYISFATLSKFYRETLEAAAEILLHPVFPEEELRTYCAKRKQRLLIDRQNVDVRAREAFARALFGERHPYGISYDGALYDTLTRADVETFYRTHYTAENCFVVCSGRITDDERQAVAAIAEQIPHGAKARPEFPAPQTTHEVKVAHAGAVQSSIRIGRLLFGREHPDFVGMQVVAAALGGYFGSRLMQNLRERHGYTYGVVAAMVNFDRAGHSDASGDRSDASGLERNIRRNRTPADRTDGRRRTDAGEEHHGGRDDAHTRRPVRHSRRDDREHPLWNGQQRHRRKSAPHPHDDPCRRPAAGAKIPGPGRPGDGGGGRKRELKMRN